MRKAERHEDRANDFQADRRMSSGAAKTPDFPHFTAVSSRCKDIYPLQGETRFAGNGRVYG